MGQQQTNLEKHLLNKADIQTSSSSVSLCFHVSFLKFYYGWEASKAGSDPGLSAVQANIC